MNRSFFISIALPAFILCVKDVFAWGGEHERITQAAVEALPQAERDDIGLEKAALVDLYCTFPDKNWPCYGEWGGGVGDPKLPRFPDTRREWEISFYCGWDPVLRKGKGYPHAPPHACEAAAALFQKAVAALQEGCNEDGMRFIGAMLHYVQDSGSFPHVQPVHRVFHVRHDQTIRADGYAPRLLGPKAAQSQSGLGFSPSRKADARTEVQTTLPQTVLDAVANRVRELVRWTEQRGSALWQDAGITFDEAKQLAAKNTMPPRVVESVKKIRAEKAAEFDAATFDCANECVRACADVIHTALTHGRQQKPSAQAAGPAKRLVFNPSFEDDDGDGVPDGWHVAWLDLNDHAGRAERYRAGTHWEKHVHTGQFSVLILCAPAKGLEWRPTWRRAVRINTGDKCRGSVWAQTRAATGVTCLALEFYDSAYKPINRACSESLSSDQEWRRLSVEAAAPQNARWLRPILRSQSNSGAVWFDDVELSVKK